MKKHLLFAFFLLVVLSLMTVSAQGTDMTVEERIDEEVAALADYPAMQSALRHWSRMAHGLEELSMSATKEFISTDYEFHDPWNDIKGLSQLHNLVLFVLRDYPDFESSFDEFFVVDENTVVVTTTSTTTDGDETFTWGGIYIFHLEDGKIINVTAELEQCATPWVTCEFR